MDRTPVHVYFHSPCFDGAVSAALLYDFHSRGQGRPVVLHPVNYHLNDTWASQALARPATVVDFLYHSAADVWFDHHATSFLNPSLEAHYRARHESLIRYDKKCTSCAQLIWSTQLPLAGDHFDKVQAADMTDSARYESPRQAVFSDAPALRINASLAIGETDEYSKFLVEQLVEHSLDSVAQLAEVEARFKQFGALRDLGLKRFVPATNLLDCDGFASTDGGIVVFAVDGKDAIISRYAPFLLVPDARYSVGAVRSTNQTKITAMRNPWMDFPSVPLGEIFTAFGGGGHQRVASTRLHKESRRDEVEVLFAVLRAIESAIVRQREEAPA